METGGWGVNDEVNWGGFKLTLFITAILKAWANYMAFQSYARHKKLISLLI